MTIDEPTKQLYRQTDSTTLLALLPELRHLVARVKQELQDREAGMKDTEEWNAEIAELHGEALAHLDARIEPADDAARESLRKLRDAMVEQRDSLHTSSKEHEFYDQTFAYLIQLMDRDRWIGEELRRRGLIPMWPGGKEDLVR